MTPSTLKRLTAAGLVTLPGLSLAANAPAAMTPCVKAFMDSLSHDRGALKLRESHFIDTGTLASSTGALTMTAWDPRNNHAVARAVCTVNASGEVVDLQTEPVAGLTEY